MQQELGLLHCDQKSNAGAEAVSKSRRLASASVEWKFSESEDAVQQKAIRALRSIVD